MEGKPVLILLVVIGSIVAFDIEQPSYVRNRRRTANVCSTDAECPDNAFCKAGTYCVCKDGYVYAATENAGKACLKVGGFGAACDKDEQCSTALGAHGTCTKKICVCKPETVLIEGRCYTVALVGERCITDYNCFNTEVLNDELARCIRGYCTCQLYYSSRNHGTRCGRDANLGDKCQDQQQCAGVGLECRGTCRCREGFVAHNKTNVCIESVEMIGSYCDYDEQCAHLSGSALGAAICSAGNCRCAYNALSRGDPGRCYYIRRPGQECRQDEECFDEEDAPGFCRGGRCTCDDCSPDHRDFADHSSAIASAPLFAAILAAAAILA